TSLPHGSCWAISAPAMSSIAACTEARRSGLVCTSTLAISATLPAGARSAVSSIHWPLMNWRRCGVMVSSRCRRPRRAIDDLVDPDAEAPGTHRGHGERRHQNRGQEQKRKDFHPPPAWGIRNGIGAFGHGVPAEFLLTRMMNLWADFL